MPDISPTNDFIDVTTFAYDIEALHGKHAHHAYVVDIGTGTRTVVATTGAGNTRTIVCLTNGEPLPSYIKSFGAATTVTRIRIFFD